MMKSMKPGQYFTLGIGIFYALIGVMGFVPEFVQSPSMSPDMANLGLTTGYGDLLGLFPVNVLHNLVHFAVGLLGIFASISLGSSRLYSGALGLFYAGLTLLGLFPPTQSMFGLIPIFGNDVWLHAITAAIAIYFGFIVTPDLLELRTHEPTPRT